MAIKGVKVGYPLKLTVSCAFYFYWLFQEFWTFAQINKKDVIESEFNPVFIERLLPKLDWAAVYSAAQVVSKKTVVISWLEYHN